MVPHRAAGGRGRQGRVTLQIGTDELAKRLYEAWRQRVDRIDYLLLEEVWTTLNGKSVTTSTVRARLKWEKLDSIQQDVWRTVAEEVGRALADAMDAQP